MMSLVLLEVSYNRPKFSACATWNPNAITLADNTTFRGRSSGLFVTTINTVYAAGLDLPTILVWPQGSVNVTQRILTSLSIPYRIFVTTNGDFYAGISIVGHRVEKWAKNATNSSTVMFINRPCNGLFVDVYDSLYCSLWADHRVTMKTVDSDANTLVIVAGTGTNGSASNMLTNPGGIFVDIELSLYVADNGNNRVQLFRFGQLNGSTVAGNGAPGTITLSGPAQVILDGNGYVFIADHGVPRIVGSGPNGFRCIAGCTGNLGPAANQFNRPYDLSFDRDGNLFVTDMYNSRLQKFMLARNFCGEFPRI